MSEPNWALSPVAPGALTKLIERVDRLEADLGAIAVLLEEAGIIEQPDAEEAETVADEAAAAAE